METDEKSESGVYSEKSADSHDSLEAFAHNSSVKSKLAFLSAYYRKARQIIEMKTRRKIEEGTMRK